MKLNKKDAQTWRKNIEQVTVRISSRTNDGVVSELLIDPLRDDPEIMAVLTVKYLEQIADHWPTSEPLDRKCKQELYDAASLINVLLLELRREEQLR
ncbi:MAG TPA: hypothetical protein VL866_24385 [Pyrinomonadaceae bacterium]|jgi:hypothetical protein|nr:hypothetical protein [Pyrinomonadaceae bacterium]